MAITIVGTPADIANNTSYTAGAGSNRVVVTPAWNRRNGAVSLTNILWNSTTRTPETTGNDSAGDDRSGTGICIFKESEIGGASNSVMTWTSSPSSQGQCPITLAGVDQTTTVRAGALSGFGGTTAVALTIPNVVAGDRLIAIVINRNGATYTINNGWSQIATGTNGDGGRWLYLQKDAAGSSDNLSVTQNAGDGWHASAAALIPSGGGGSTAGRNRMLMGFG